MPARQPASFNAPFSRIAGSRAACLQLGGATREKALFILGLPVLRQNLIRLGCRQPMPASGRGTSGDSAQGAKQDSWKPGSVGPTAERCGARELNDRHDGRRIPSVTDAAGLGG